MSAAPFIARAMPKGAPSVRETSAALLPALAIFRACRTPFDVRLALDALPEHIADGLAAHVAERPAMFDAETARELVRAVGYGRLSRIMGHQKARGAVQRLFPQAN